MEHAQAVKLQPRAVFEKQWQHGCNGYASCSRHAYAHLVVSRDEVRMEPPQRAHAQLGEVLDDWMIKLIAVRLVVLHVSEHVSAAREHYTGMLRSTIACAVRHSELQTSGAVISQSRTQNERLAVDKLLSCSTKGMTITPKHMTHYVPWGW